MLDASMLTRNWRDKYAGRIVVFANRLSARSFDCEESFLKNDSSSLRMTKELRG
jgi:hypothetical protein